MTDVASSNGTQTDFNDELESTLLAAYMARLSRPIANVSTQCTVDGTSAASSALTTVQLHRRQNASPSPAGSSWQHPTAVMVGSTTAKHRQLGWREVEDAYHRHRRIHPVEDLYSIAVEQLVPVTVTGGLPPLKHRSKKREVVPVNNSEGDTETVSWIPHINPSGLSDPKTKHQAATTIAEVEQQLYLHPSIASTLPLEELLRIEEATRRRARVTAMKLSSLDGGGSPQRGARAD